MTLRRNLLAGIALLALAEPALASELSGKALDNVANAISWVVLVFVPVAGIYLFWILHIWPEKIAHKKRHPQKEAIHALCLLSLFFGGLLWPLAWLWAHTKPVFYRAAYGTDKAPEDDESTEGSNARTDGGAVALRAAPMAPVASAMRGGKEPI
jgi:CBS domain containing-hemolysin-like protein